MAEMSRSDYPKNEIRLIWDISSSERIENVDELYGMQFEAALTDAGFNEDDIFYMGLGFREVLANAIAYGNLGLAKDDSNKNDFHKIILAAKEKVINKGKTVHVSMSIKPGEVMVVVQDQGRETKEFWKGKRQDPLNEGLKDHHGRGELLERKGFDNLDYEKNETGVKVTLTKKVVKV